MIKILYITDTGKLGGSERVLLVLLANIDRKKFDPFVVVGSNGPLVDEIHRMGIEYSIVAMPEMASPKFRLFFVEIYNLPALIRNIVQWSIVAIKLFLFLRESNYEIVHTNGLQAELCGSIAARATGKKLVWHAHNIQPPGMRRWVARRMAKIFPHRIIVVSKAVKSIYQKSIIDPEKLHLIYNGFSVENIEREGNPDVVRREFGIDDGTAVVAMISVLRPGKGHETFLSAAVKIKKEYPNVKFLVVGGELLEREKTYKMKLARVAYELGISKDAIFTGFRQDIPRILSAIDVLVFPPFLPDSLPTVLIEAMGMGKPVVVTRIGGIPEIVVNGITGFLVPPQSPEEIAKHVLILLRDKSLAREMGVRGKEFVRTHFASSRFIGEIEKLYQTL